NAPSAGRPASAKPGGPAYRPGERVSRPPPSAGPMDTFLRDVRHTVRLLLKEKTFSGTVLLTLAICIGANVAIFSVIRTVLLEPLPFYEPDRLVTVNNSYPGAGAARASNGSVDFFERRENVPAFREVALYRGGGVKIGRASCRDGGQRPAVT